MLHHVELYVSDLAGSLRFWTPLFGLLDYREFQRWPQAVSHMHGDTTCSGPNDYALYCEDPDRIKVEVVAPT